MGSALWMGSALTSGCAGFRAQPAAANAHDMAATVKSLGTIVGNGPETPALIFS
jgi:hypothetical protein